MKRIFCLLACAVCILTSLLFAPQAKAIDLHGDMPVTATMYADDDGFFDKIIDFFDALLNLLQYGSTVAPEDPDYNGSIVQQVCDSFLTFIANTVTYSWDGVMSQIVPDEADDDIMNGTLNNVINASANVLGLLAYGISAIAILLGVANTARNLDAFSSDKVLELLLTLGINAVWIYFSVQICKLVYIVNFDFCARIANNAPSLLNGETLITVPDSSYFNFIDIDLWLIGPLLELIAMILMLIPLVLSILAIGVVAILVAIKLKIRTIEIACMMSLAPPFFACARVEETKSLFRNFFINYLGVVVETLYMTLILAVGMSVNLTMLPEAFEGAASGIGIGDYLFLCIYPLALGCMLFYPPAALRNLLK